MLLDIQKTDQSHIDGFNPTAKNDIKPEKVSGAAKFGFWFCTIITFGIFFAVVKYKTRTYLNKKIIRVNEYSSGIDIQLEKRYNILTKLVSVAKANANLDNSIYKLMTAYRSGIPNPSGFSNGVDTDKITDLSRRDRIYDQIRYGIGNVIEAYPNLSSSETIRSLNEQINFVENEIVAVRSYYNKAVTEFNQKIYSWPANVVIEKENYKALPLFITSSNKRQDVNTSFYTSENNNDQNKQLPQNQ